MGDFFQSMGVRGSEEQEWEGTILSEMGKGSDRVFCRNVPKEYYSKRFRKVIIPEGLGSVMFDL